jgi:hypothetical protein
MPFITLNNIKNALWAEYGYELIAVMVVIVSCICVLCCNNVECAVLIVQLLTVVYCILWIMAIVQMRMLVLAKLLKKKNKD